MSDKRYKITLTHKQFDLTAPVALVNVSVRGHESVQYDEFYTDDGSYLDSGYEIGTEATAWMPFPEPYKESEE